MSKIGRSLKKFVKHKKPEICMIAGGILGAAAVVTACIQTRKGFDKLAEEHKVRIEKARSLPEDNPKKGKAIIFAYGRTFVSAARLYAGPFACFVGSGLAIYSAHHTMKLRNAGLATALAGAKKELKDYRKRVSDDLGEEAEEKLYFGTKTKEIKESRIDEDGNEVFDTVLADDIIDDVEDSDYVKYFTKGNPNWDRSPDLNMFFLNQQMRNATDRLKYNGELTLNEVYDMLGFERTEAGMVVGWIYDKYNPFGDNEVIFRYKKVHVPNENGNGYSIGYAIDFNVDGNIYNEKIRRRNLTSFRKR